MTSQSNVTLIQGDDGRKRCYWCGSDALYVQYHDEEWGRVVTDDRRLFEKICLEGFQAGLSWITILKKREAFREAFDDFDASIIAKYKKRKVEQLLSNAGIVRHRGKIESTINNAQRSLELSAEFGSLFEYFHHFAPKKKITLRRRDQIQATTAESTALSKDLKKRGWSFVGPTTCYAFMQAMGLVNDHFAGCHVRNQM